MESNQTSIMNRRRVDWKLDERNKIIERVRELLKSGICMKDAVVRAQEVELDESRWRNVTQVDRAKWAWLYDGLGESIKPGIINKTIDYTTILERLNKLEDKLTKVEELVLRLATRPQQKQATTEVIPKPVEIHHKPAEVRPAPIKRLLILILDVSSSGVRDSLCHELSGHDVRFRISGSSFPQQHNEYNIVVATKWTNSKWLEEARRTPHLRDVLIETSCDIKLIGTPIKAAIAAIT